MINVQLVPLLFTRATVGSNCHRRLDCHCLGQSWGFFVTSSNWQSQDHQTGWKWLCQRWEHVQLENGKTVSVQLANSPCLPVCLLACVLAHQRRRVEAGKQSYNMQEADECCLPIYLPLYWMLPCLIAHSCFPVLEHFLHIGNMSRDARFSKFVLTLCSVLWNHNLPC